MNLKTLTIHNLYSFGDAVCVFADGKTIILGKNNDDPGMDSNGSGKSSIPNIVFWVITGEIFQKENTDEIIRHGERAGSAELILSDDSTELKIFRGRGKKFLKVEYNKQNKTCTTDSETQKELFKILNVSPLLKPTEYVSDYLNTTYFSTATVKGFMSKDTSSKERFGLIERFIGAKKYTYASNYAKDRKKDELSKITGLLDEIAIKEQFLKDNPEEGIKHNLKEYEDDLSSTTLKITALEGTLSKFKAKNSLKQTIDAKEAALAEKKKSVTDRLDVIDQLIIKNNKDLESLRAEFQRIKTLKLEVEKDQTTAAIRIGRQAKIEEQISCMNKSSTECSSANSVLQTELKFITNQLSNNYKCPKCQTSLMMNRNVLLEINLSALQQRKTEIENAIELNNDNLQNNSKIITSLGEEGREILGFLQQYNTKVGVLNSKSIESVELQIRGNEQSTINFTNQNNAIVDQGEVEVKTLQSEVDTLKLEYAKTPELDPNIEIALAEEKRKLEFSNREIGQLNRRLDEINGFKIKLEELNKKVSEQKAIADIYGFWEIGFNEIKMNIIDEFLPAFEERVNHYLNKLKVEMAVTFDTQKEKANVTKKDAYLGRVYKEEFNVEVLKGEINIPFGMLSQGERGRISSCVGLALRELTKERGSNIFDFFFMDEIADALDETGLRELIMLLDETPGQKIVISHNDAFKDYFDNRILVEKTGGLSKIDTE
jgi:DNA repair exonuclease SbcCD ATPase subunit